VTGAVTALLDAGLLLTLLAVDDELARDIDELKITVRLRCGFHCLANYSNSISPSSSFPAFILPIEYVV